MCRFFRVKQAARLLCSNSAVTDGTEVNWDDIHKFLHFIDRLEVLVGHFNGGRTRGICVPLLHTLNRSNCVEKLIVRAIFCYIFCSYTLAYTQFYRCDLLETGTAEFYCSYTDA